MKIFLIISVFLTVASAQQHFLGCSYFLIGTAYACDLTINNPNAWDNFTEIGGIHLEGFADAAVERIYRRSGSESSNVPSIICETFPNLRLIQLYDIGLEEIGDSAFSGCSGLIEVVLSSNRIRSISSIAFSNLVHVENINLYDNSLTTLPENVFESQSNLTTLDMSINPFENIPVALFRPLANLRSLYLNLVNISTINNQWFTNNGRLNNLYLANNRISVSEDSFVGLDGLHTLSLAYNTINEVPSQALSRLHNLQRLYLFGNNLTELEENSFPDLQRLETLDISDNPISAVQEKAFQGLTNLNVLIISNCRLQQLHSNSFEDLRNLTFLSLNFNQIEELPQSIFVHLPNLFYLGLWNNRLKTLRRNRFALLSNLQTLDLEGNVVNGMDRSIIDDAVNLETLYFIGNLCASNYFGNFPLSRDQYLLLLGRCFSNMRYIVDTVTEGNDDFTFFDGPHPGIALRVNTVNEVQISLTPFDVIWNPVIEILIGTSNNTRSAIRINQETIVATVPTPNIISSDRWNDFRVTWANQIILVFRGNDSFPFMGFTMKDIFPVNFYGLRAVDTRASWSVQPFDW